jgi:hypothetical protein
MSEALTLKSKMAYIKDAIYRELKRVYKESPKDCAYYIQEINRQVELFKRDIENVMNKEWMLYATDEKEIRSLKVKIDKADTVLREKYGVKE